MYEVNEKIFDNNNTFEKVSMAFLKDKLQIKETKDKNEFNKAI